MNSTGPGGGWPARVLRRGRGVMALALVVPLAACSVGPNFVTPQASVEARWKDAGFPAVKTNRDDYERWWASFRDPALSRLVDLAYSQNLTLMEAGARVIEARAVLGQAIGEVYPQTQQLNGDGDLSPAEPDGCDLQSERCNQLEAILAGRPRRPGRLGARSLGQVPPRRRAGRRRLSRLDRHLRRRARHPDRRRRERLHPDPHDLRRRSPSPART